MADDPKSVPPAPHVHFPLVEEWSSISQGDLGLKAMYWTDDSKTALTSRPIVGWITFGSKRVIDVVPKSGFAAVVIADNWMPAVVGAVPRHACIAPKDAANDQIIAKMAEWGAKPNPAPSGLTN
jgi:hypothetical protein